ncbi:MAG: zinc-ribbon domain-containing protein [Candidatus Heimdallarchaeota archaeon]
MTLTDVKYCPECGSKNSLDKNFCGSCGASFETKPTPAPAVTTAATPTITQTPTTTPETAEEKTGIALGVVSLVFSILGFSCLPIFGSIVAIITGFLTSGWKNNKFALAGIIIGFIGLAVIGGGVILGIAYLAMV